MSIVAVHGPQTFGSRAVVEVGAAMGTVSPTNGLSWSFKTDRPSTRTTSLAWNFGSGSTPGTATGPGPHAVVYGAAGPKVVTMTATGVGEGANPYPVAGVNTMNITAVTGSGQPQVSLRSLPPEDTEEEITQELPATDEVPVGYDPAAHTVSEVQEYVTEHPEQLEEMYEAEVAGKARSTLVAWLEEQFPFDPDAWTVQEVVDYASANPAELEDIIAAEQAGKNRTTLVSQLEAMRS